MADRRLAVATDEDVGRAVRQGLVVGLREHLPGAVGIVAKGTPLCAVAAFAHLVLGATVPASAVSAALASVGLGGSAWIRGRSKVP